MVTGIQDRWSVFETAPELVKKKFDQTMAMAVSAYETVNGAIQSLQLIGRSLALINRQVSIDTTTISGSSLSATPPNVDDSLFTIDTVDLPADPNVVDVSIDAFPNFPNLSTGDIQAPSDTYSSALLSAIRNKLISDIQTGSTGLTPAVEDAIFQREYERSLIAHNDSLDRIAAHWSDRGWPMPNDMLKGALMQEEIAFTNKRQDVSRDIAIKSFELALQNYHFVIQQGIILESHLITWTHSIAVLALEASKLVVQSRIEAFKAMSENVRAQVTAIVEKYMAKIQYNKNLIEIYLGRIQAYSAKIQGEAARVNAVARGAEARTAIFSATTQFDIQKAGLDLKVLELRLQQAIANANIMIKDKEVEQKNYELLNALKMEAMKAAGAIAAQMEAGALAGVSAAAHMNAAASSNYSYSTGPTE